ncbi:pantothenate kinase [Cyanobacteria bacterium FACHB-DQ100]|nr:pantothenate kinase [Cyanobacteria bacterium FACHB-DQ100]
MKLITNRWIALNIGNSRLHWALFENDQIQQRYNMSHIAEDSVILLNDRDSNSTAKPISLVYQSLPWMSIDSELWVASVVPKQVDYWRNVPNFHGISLSEIPLHQLYSTLGVDRALALWGAIQVYGSPALVIDCGTAMTFTGANEKHELIGGAIVPGVRLQFQALGQQTAALPTIGQVETLPERWARNTQTAIESGILNTLLAGIRSFVEDWNQQFERSTIVLTGGDAELIYRLFEQTEPRIFEQLRLDLDLVFWGMRSVRNALKP